MHWMTCAAKVLHHTKYLNYSVMQITLSLLRQYFSRFLKILISGKEHQFLYSAIFWRTLEYAREDSITKRGMFDGETCD